MSYVKSPRDGLRAVCPAFQHRCSIGKHHWIVCTGARPQFMTREERDRHYRDVCCKQGAESCEYSCARRHK